MKKGIIVLLITVLAAGMVFAGTLTGSAGIEFGYNLDSKVYGFKNDSGMKYSFTFEVDATTKEVAEHETSVWAEVGAKGHAQIKVSNFTETTTDPAIKIDTLKITKANIHIGEDITIGILNAGGKYDYAADYHLDSSGKPVNDVVISNVLALDGTTSLSAPGFTVTYKEWKGGFGFTGNGQEGIYKVLAHAQTKSFTFAEGLTAQAAGLAYLANDDKVASASAKVNYSADKLAAGVAGDFQYAQKKFVFEVAANASYDFVSLDVYTTAGQLSKSKNMYTGEKNVKLDTQLAAEYTFEGDVPVTVEGLVDLTDLLVDGREITIAAGASATVEEKLTVALAAEYAIKAKTLGLNIEVSYAHDLFTAYAKLGTDDADFTFKFGADPALQALGVELGVSSTTIVENATLALVYSGADFAKSGDSVVAKGAITASAKISF